MNPLKYKLQDVVRRVANARGDVDDVSDQFDHRRAYLRSAHAALAEAERYIHAAIAEIQ
jgi:hypothetical protein